MKRALAAIGAWLPINAKLIAVFFGYEQGVERDKSGQTSNAWGVRYGRMGIRMILATNSCA